MKTFQQMATENRAKGIISKIGHKPLPPTRKFDTVGEMVAAHSVELGISEQAATALVRRDCYPGDQGKACWCIWVNPKNAYGAYWGYVDQIVTWV